MKNIISAIIPTYNRQPLLIQAIDSVLQQTVQNIEIVVVDDGSKVPVCEHDYFKKKQISLYRQDNAGLNAARNFALKKAKGEYIALLDDDDLWLPFKTEIQIAVIKKFPKVSFVFSDFTIFDESGIKSELGLATWNDFPSSWITGRESEYSAVELGLPLPPNGHDYKVFYGNLYYNLLQEPYVLPSTALICRNAIRWSEPFPTKNIHCGDWQFFAELARSTPCVFLSLPTAMNRSHNDAVRLTRKSPCVRIQDRINMISDVWRADQGFMSKYGREVLSIKAEQLSLLSIACLLDGQQREAIKNLDRLRHLSPGTFGIKQWLFFIAAYIPLSSILLRWARIVKAYMRSIT